MTETNEQRLDHEIDHVIGIRNSIIQRKNENYLIDDCFLDPALEAVDFWLVELQDNKTRIKARLWDVKK